MATCHPFKAVLTANSTSTGFTAQNTTTTDPAGTTGVIDLLEGSSKFQYSGNVPSWVQLMPFGTNGENDTFDMRVYGLNAILGATPIFVPQLLLDVSVILSALTATHIAADTFLADTFVLNDGAADLDGAFEQSPWVSVISPAEDLPGSILLHTRGCRYLKFDWDLAGGQEGVSMNCLWRPAEI